MFFLIRISLIQVLQFCYDLTININHNIKQQFIIKKQKNIMKLSIIFALICLFFLAACEGLDSPEPNSFGFNNNAQQKLKQTWDQTQNKFNEGAQKGKQVFDDTVSQGKQKIKNLKPSPDDLRSKLENFDIKEKFNEGKQYVKEKADELKDKIQGSTENLSSDQQNTQGENQSDKNYAPLQPSVPNFSRDYAGQWRQNQPIQGNSENIQQYNQNPHPNHQPHFHNRRKYYDPNYPRPKALNFKEDVSSAQINQQP